MRLSSLMFRAILVSVALPVQAGVIGLSWDAVPGAAGYKVYYGVASEHYTHSVDAGNTTTLDLGNLADCTTYYVAVKAYNQQGESGDYSAEISGWARPHVDPRVTPVRQGDQIVLTIEGGSFASGADLAVDAGMPIDGLGNPLVRVSSVSVVSCERIQALLTVEPTADGLQAMAVGEFDLGFEVINPDGVYNAGSTVLEVQFDEDRADINQRNERTTDRVDGDDLASLVRIWGSTNDSANFEYPSDLDGDLEIDGDDLALLASVFGQCRNASGWSVNACL